MDYQELKTYLNSPRLNYYTTLLQHAELILLQTTETSSKQVALDLHITESKFSAIKPMLLAYLTLNKED